jgi:HEAT repeat protein
LKDTTKMGVALIVGIIAMVWWYGLEPVWKEKQRVNELIRELKDPDPHVRAEAAGRWARQDARVVDPLIESLKRDPDSEVRGKAASALGTIHDPRAIGPLVAAALNDTDSQIRIYAAAALQEWRYIPRATGALIPALSKHDTAVIAGAYRFFIERGEAGSEDALIEALNKRDSMLRKEHASNAKQRPASDETKKMAEEFLNSGNPKLKHAAEFWAYDHRDTIVVRREADGSVK